MTKLISSVIVLLASSAAFAYPTVGDHVLMTGTATVEGDTAPFSLERTIKSYDAASTTWVISETQTIDGQAQTADSTSTTDDMLTQAQVTKALVLCSAYGGQKEVITVKAGTYDTCALPMNDDSGNQTGTAWIGDVEFGVVKVTGTQDGIDYVLELEQHSGN